LKLRLAPAAIRDLERLRQFLEGVHPASAAAAAGRIIQAIENVIEYPGIGRNLPQTDIREVFVRFGRSGYIIR
jgi:plasmid stabilization system protein ParE